MDFKLTSKYKPAGDQPKAIAELRDGLLRGNQYQTLLGVTGSGKTFSIANVIEAWRKPTLIIAHNKTLAAQLCNEFRELFPQNAVHYFVSYYDYYQPEAYLPRTDTYIEKEATINDEIDKLRHAATQSLLTRQDVIIVASVSCIYGLGAPATYRKIAQQLEVGQIISRTDILHNLIALQFSRTNADLKRGTFRWRAQALEIMPVNQELIYRIEMSAQKIDRIFILDPLTRKIREQVNEAIFFPARHFVTLRDELSAALDAIRAELSEQLKLFERQGKLLEAERLERRVKMDLEMIEQVGFCHGIENYSRHLSRRLSGEPGDTLLAYFPDDFLIVIDESHVTVPQLGGMYEGDAARKKTLIEYGFRLPSASDNRPLKFNEFQRYAKRVIFTSATPSIYEKKVSQQIVEQIIRPTGLVDPAVIVRPITSINQKSKTKNQKLGMARPRLLENRTQVDDLIERVQKKVAIGDRVLVTTLTKKMAEDLTEFLQAKKIKTEYLHSEVDTLDRIRILMDFRKGKFDVLVGVNLLREGLDLPEVSLVAILDADKEGFLRSETSLIQTIGRAARNVRGEVVLYADQITGSIKRALDETDRRRKLQLEYNKRHGITPRTIKKRIHDIFEEWQIINPKSEARNLKQGKEVLNIELQTDKRPVEVIIREKELQMKEAAQGLEFELAALIRDEIKLLKQYARQNNNQRSSRA